MKAMILSGGRGKRLRPVTDTIPKPLIKIHGKPLIEWSIKYLKKFGIDEIIICSGYRSKQIENFLKKKKNFTRFLKGKLTSTNNGNLQVEILKGQESFRIKSFVKSNVWGVFKAGQSIFKKGQLIECYFPIVSNKNIFY